MSLYGSLANTYKCLLKLSPAQLLQAGKPDIYLAHNIHLGGSASSIAFSCSFSGSLSSFSIDSCSWQDACRLEYASFFGFIKFNGIEIAPTTSSIAYASGVGGARLW